ISCFTLSWSSSVSIESLPVVRSHLTGNQKSKISDDGVNAGILSLYQDRSVIFPTGDFELVSRSGR
ncbi:MAG: hypothetical protein V5A32_07985, partial [Halovenus sp.]